MPVGSWKCFPLNQRFNRQETAATEAVVAGSPRGLQLLLTFIPIIWLVGPAGLGILICSGSAISRGRLDSKG